MSQASRIQAIHYEFLHSLFLPNKPSGPPRSHWSDLTKAELLERGVARAPESKAAWLALGDHWLTKGNFIRAAAAFSEAHKRAPDDPWPLMRRGTAYLTLDPTQSDRDFQQAQRLGGKVVEPRSALRITAPASDETVSTIYADITDMVDYLGINNTFSGIQRVVANIFRQVRERSTPHTRDVVPVIPDYLGKIVYAADIAIVNELIDTIERGKPSRVHLDRLLAAVKSSLRVVRPEPGSIFLMAGAFWIVESYDLLKELRQADVAVTVFIHDLIQIDNPEYVHRAATETFLQSLVDIAEVSTFLTTNSIFVANEVKRFLNKEMELDKTVHPVPLATELNQFPATPWQDDALQTEFGEDGYVLCVCTLEIRKNHIYLFNIWRELVSRSVEHIPTLILVGKWGWEIEDFQRTLEASNYLDGRIKVMTAVSDELLASLYRNCLFTIYPSFAEGWGLPIGESLVFGKPCICSGVTSMPEVGGDLVQYVDPEDVDSGFAAVSHLLSDRLQLARWTSRVQRDFIPRSWADFAEHLLGASRGLAESLQDQMPVFARLKPGTVAVVGNNSLVEAAQKNHHFRTARMAREKGWDHIEGRGAWSTSSIATLRFLADGCPPGTGIRLVLVLRGESGHSPACCQIRSGASLTPLTRLFGTPTEVACETVVGPDGYVDAQVIARNIPLHLNGRGVFLCLMAIGYHRLDSDEQTLQLMESLRFDL